MTFKQPLCIGLEKNDKPQENSKQMMSFETNNKIFMHIHSHYTPALIHCKWKKDQNAINKNIELLLNFFVKEYT